MSLLVQASVPPQGGPEEKPKTKAKQRYLKAKKGRRKARKHAGPKPFGEGKKKRLAVSNDGKLHKLRNHEKSEKESNAEVTGQDDQGEDGSEVDDNDASDASENEIEDNTDAEQDLSVPTADIDTDKIFHHDLGTRESSLPNDIHADPLQKDASHKPEDGSTSTAAQFSSSYLYRFPRPQQTTDPNSDLLALQGIPEALLRPTDVATTNTLALDTPDTHGVRLSPPVHRQLEQLGIREWFAVQGAVIPALLRDAHAHHLYLPYAPPRDLCISAPTGSGKTLAYVVPIIEVLHKRTIPQLRALILVPTRDLAVQVRDVLEAVGKGSGLRYAMITGNHSFRHEQDQLVRSDSDVNRSPTDILIATPGRLVDHLRGTRGFTLEHLRYLVIDEADRLLGQSFQQWVPTLLDALEPRPHSGSCAPPSLWKEAGQEHNHTWTRDDMQVPQASVQKLLFSATLTRDPAKVGALRLRQPQFIRVRDPGVSDGQGLVHEQHFALPAGLQQHMLVVPTSQKVLHLLHLLHTPSGDMEPLRHALCFTKSVETANRLVRLVAFFEEAWSRHTNTPALQVRFYSSDLGTGERIQLLRDFQHGHIDLLVCSDLIARGIDLPHVRHVISYDVPVDMAKYVHRVGRTARAGRAGDAWSLVEEQEVYHFKRMLREAGHFDQMQKHKVKSDVFDTYLPCYRDALARLAHMYSQQR